MSVFLDTGVYYARHDEDAVRHRSATDALRRLLTGEFGHLYTSDYDVDEAITLTLARSGSAVAARSMGERILGRGGFQETATVVHLGKQLFESAFRDFTRYGDDELSFADASTVAVIDDRSIDQVLSYDANFDGIVDRLDPESLVGI